LRQGSAAEARTARRWARAAGLKAHILTVKGAPARSDIEAEARAARYALMGAHLRRAGLGTLFLGHTRDDQAETFLLRLGRGSGLDGLSAMRVLAPFPLPGFAGLTLARPLLGLSRQDLRGFLKGRGAAWLEDPMNSEERFARTKLRRLAPHLAAAGLSPERIADAADHLARAREALEMVTGAVLARAVRPVEGGLLLDSLALAAAPREVGLRALARVLMELSGGPYRPRFDSLERLFNALAGGTLRGGASLAGCLIKPAPRRFQAFGPQTLVLTRETARKKTR
jgi:tRNA(Ile)-lysidine synthase